MKKVNFEKISVHDVPENSPGFLLWHISTSWRSFIESVLKPLGLTHPQFVILATTGWLTKEGESTTQIAISNMAGLDPNTTSQIIKGLEKKDLIKRTSSSDGRAKNPFLTTKGKDLLSKALPAVELKDAHFFDVLTKSELKTAISLFRKLLPTI